ncbi:MAG: hypothetical protein IT336_15860, partial [Thermomicrobiales bacterium]|nr:hypothetical protein [Thermomicrobiales bacterium]
MSDAGPERGAGSGTVVDPPPLRSSRLLWIGASGVLGALLVLLFFLRPDNGDDPAGHQTEGDPVLGLLAWIPATATTNGMFAVWTPDRGLATPAAAGEAFDVAARLSLQPEIEVVGSSSSFGQRYGWGAGQVSGWAVAGAGSELTVLTGAFDLTTIADRLEASGYTRSGYRGADLFMLGDVTDVLNAIAWLDGRLLISRSEALVRAAIDTVVDGEASLADEPAIAGTVRTLAPLNALVAVDLARHAAGCLPGEVATAQPLAGEYVMVGYGRSGPGGERRTLIATTFADEATASVALPGYEDGWFAGYANAGGLGGRIEDFGTLTVVTQSDRALVAELVDGRDDGWVRAGIRYAIPVCEAAVAVAEPASPVAAPPARTVMTRLAMSLPEIAGSGTFRAVDVAGIASARAIPAPAPGATRDQMAAWQRRLGPLPAFAVAPIA